MRKFDVTLQVTEYTYPELSETDARLAHLALEATKGAYAPYSHFSVGAAILLDNGQIVTGANQENAAFSSGTCAERSACFYAGAQYPNVPFSKIAIAARGTDGEILDTPISPCGACRQALMEYETMAGRPVPVLLVGREKVWEVPSVASTLPLTFTEF